MRCCSCVAYLSYARFDDDDSVVSGLERLGPFAAALADATLQPALSQVCIELADTAQPAFMGTLVDAALSRRLRELKLALSCTPPAAAPLARLLAGGSLQVLEISELDGYDTPLFDEAGAALVADALRVNTTLTALNLCDARLCVDVRVAELLFGALVGHPSLRVLRVTAEDTDEDDCSALGAALAALIAADAPALRVLDCRHDSLGDTGLAPIVEALALNRQLHELDLSLNDMSEEFSRERLLPAVRANTTLREFRCENYEEEPPSAEEAVELVWRRWQHD